MDIVSNVDRSIEEEEDDDDDDDFMMRSLLDERRKGGGLSRFEESLVLSFEQGGRT